MWTKFWDMNSGGVQKEEWKMIYIEAPIEEAKTIFYNRFGHSPERVSCTCCGEDYSISEHESLAQLTGLHRDCIILETPRDPKTGLYNDDDPIIKSKGYLEKDDPIPEGYKLSILSSFQRNYQTLDEYCSSPGVLVIRSDEIKEIERNGSVPKQGYVWID